MKNLVYENIHTGERVCKDEWEEYVKEKLGIEIKPLNKGEMTLEQIDFINTMIEWYFSDNWIKKEIEEGI